MARFVELFGMIITLLVLAAIFVIAFQALGPVFYSDYTNTPGIIVPEPGDPDIIPPTNTNQVVDVNDETASLFEELELTFSFEADDLDLENVYNAILGEGVVGNGFYFIGIAKAYMQLEPEEISNNVTYSLWIKPEYPGRVPISFVSDLSGDGDSAFYYEHQRGQIAMANNKTLEVRLISFDEECSGEEVFIKTQEKVNVGEWNHLVLSVDFDDNFSTKLYLDGEKVGETTGKSCSNNNNYIWIGREKGEGYPYKGNVDEFKQWNRVLTHEEVIELYEGEKIED